MKYRGSAIILIAFLFLLNLTVFAQETELKVVDEVVAQVNDGVITLSLVKREMNMIIDSMVEQGKNRDEAKTEIAGKQGEIIASLINEELLLQKAKEIGLDAEVEAEINQRLAEIMKQQNIKSLDALYQEMEKQGVEPQELRESWRKQITKEKVLQREVDGRLYWGWQAKEIKSYYEKHKDKFTKPETLKLSEIFLSFAGRDENAVREKARQLAAEIRKGADFTKLALENSDRQDVKESKGSVGTITVGELDEKFAKPLQNVKAGGISDPIETVEGMEILRIDERQEASKESFFDETEVRKAMTYEIIPEERKKYMVTLREEAYIKINDTYRPIVSPILFAEERKTEEKKPSK